MPMMTVPLLMKLMQQTAAAIAHLHTKHVIHRDLKPHNVFISKEGDFTGTSHHCILHTIHYPHTTLQPRSGTSAWRDC
jgi:serine/threonine protein kinase